MLSFGSSYVLIKYILYVQIILEPMSILRKHKITMPFSTQWYSWVSFNRSNLKHWHIFPWKKKNESNRNSRHSGRITETICIMVIERVSWSFSIHTPYAYILPAHSFQSVGEIFLLVFDKNHRQTLGEILWVWFQTITLKQVSQ